MDLDKKYYDSEGNECSIIKMIRREPEWSANMVQCGERARTALIQCVKVLKMWHGDTVFDIYFDHSPEMIIVRDYLGKYKNLDIT